MRKVRRRKQDMIDREIELHLKAYKEAGAEQSDHFRSIMPPSIRNTWPVV